MSEFSAKIVVRKSKKGKKIVEVKYNNGKKDVSISLSDTTQIAKISDDMNEKDCLFGTEGGKAVKLVVDGNILFDKNLKKDIKPKEAAGGMMKKGKIKEPVGEANAPYNFVPLNEMVVENEHQTWEALQKNCGFAKYHENTYSGEIELKITTKTPLYIRDAKTPDMTEGENPSSFFSPSGKPQIPGSSIRGLVSSLVEIASYSKFSFVDEKNLYYRNIGDEFYRNTMISQSGGAHAVTKAGILKEKNGKYYIYPSKKRQGTQVYRVNFNSKNRKIECNPHIRPNEFSCETVYFKPVPETVHIHHHGGKKVELKYGLLDSVSKNKKEGYVKGHLVSSGNFSTKKHMHWVINEVENPQKGIEIENTVVESYERDDQRNGREIGNLLNYLETHPEGVPCFYLESRGDGKISSFGHTGLYRLPYKKSVTDHIPNKTDPKMDMHEAIFGDADHMMGRVAFEDALCVTKTNHIKDLFEKEAAPKILSSPKPTTFQHYLEQSSGINTLEGQHENWNDTTPIRGYKQYWHKDDVKWSEQEEIVKKHPKQYTKITPVKKNIHFKGKIRFENLTAVELGALIFVLDLPENHYHKLGMGKPLGLGSVHILPTLSIIDRRSEKGRYSKLFNGNGWHEAKNEHNKRDFITVFEKYVLDHLKISQTSLWNIERMKELLIILDWKNANNQNWHNKISYLNLKEFKKRRVLPRPSEV